MTVWASYWIQSLLHSAYKVEKQKMCECGVCVCVQCDEIRWQHFWLNFTSYKGAIKMNLMKITKQNDEVKEIFDN